jgi:hypothetical protein
MDKSVCVTFSPTTYSHPQTRAFKREREREKTKHRDDDDDDVIVRWYCFPSRRTFCVDDATRTTASAFVFVVFVFVGGVQSGFSSFQLAQG